MRGSFATLFLSGTMLAFGVSACMHDWDALEAPADGSGGTGTGSGTSGGGGNGTGGEAECPSEDTSVSGMCATYCDQVNSCVIEDPNCVQECEAALSACPSGARESIRSCLDSIDTCGCAGICGAISAFDTGFLVCIATTVSCWDPPHECP